jgi:DNA (cytosine-5)-methyltransferase 1
MVKEFVIDLFCGAGGTATGIHLANCDSEVVACVNHDAKAIESHKLNHPKAVHYTEDIRNPEVVAKLKIQVQELRYKYPLCVITIWASLECTNFSKAKGGLPRDADSRTLAEHLNMYVEAINPEYLMIENVQEFMSWGPLDTLGKPISRFKGSDYTAWVDSIKKYGYDFDYRILNSADFGAPQSRKRYFSQFAKIGMPIEFPLPTHNKKGTDGLLKHSAVRHVLDLTDIGASIFNRKKLHVENTHKRILAGLKKSVVSTDKDFLTTYYGSGACVHSVDRPSPCLTTKDRVAKVHFLMLSYTTGDNVKDIDGPAGTVMVNDKHNFVTAEHFVYNPQYKNTGSSIERPSPTVIARQDKAPLYLISYVFDSELKIPIYETDNPTLVKIKEFMAANGIVDVLMRLFYVPELLAVQGFPKDYKLVGTLAEQKKFIGNAVETTIAKKLFEAHSSSIDYLRSLDSAVLRTMLCTNLIIG